MSLKSILQLAAATFLFPLFFSSCANVRKTEYFADQQDAIIKSSNTAAQSIIQPNDIFSITVSSLNPTATAIFNTPNISSVIATTATGSSLQSPGYLVNLDGIIQFPVIGDIKVSGLTTNQLRLMITKELLDRKLLVDAVVVVRQLNFKVSILGEVGHPTVISVPSEKISLLEALGLAGDITIYGKKDNVMVIREENGEKRIKRLDLNSKDLFTSQYYYLKSNDIVYVEANRAKVNNSSQTTQLIPIGLSILSFVAIIATVIIRK
ncbi:MULTISPECIES: polysaccharide biosynthesis/export family protein [unclassified Mucilaginibacter]|uniref:polysaccharide biosynthesis/export family protein n=1 Tax=unclassified Mucilaginibacter TaxID=2617802 RepID=UPI002AC956A3|nr:MULTISPECIES: polysaccharide biosynthesis/export family protein [unclassified Mucilaginibacter]MEB0261125.1 polysaccharide biosynthesis/export family protein [Mucilaginibacter sp. 10I4]MEB0280500.1 polysaccharide biosynthesis/export family protein [Mucilaginibacter sp. 10B2]MEB0301294.1 polysaccharide biosynthesis/export family protein [Mucilaginibacter sp. 5C4]WPX22474.1 polysaccharide biosynthesis/export family protein [Mucilaginibacter sp. 5C4]